MLVQIHHIDGKPGVVNVLHEGAIHTAIAGVHPNFDAIASACSTETPDASVLDLFDMQQAVSTRFQKVSDRVSVRDGNVYFDGDVVNNTLTEKIVSLVQEGEENYKPLVNFMEKVMTNPNPNSRDQLFLWLDNGDFTITANGDFVGYKGVRANESGAPTSTVAAPAKDQVTVNGEPVTGYVPNPDGAVVEMPRSVVDPNEGSYCSVGLHVGTYSYASGFTGHVLEVHVNPRDVVSVTSDSSRQKIRTCRYTVVSKVEARYTSTYLPGSNGFSVEDDYDDEDYEADLDAFYDDDEDDDFGFVDVTKARLVDTRQNHLRQKRGPGGKFVR